MPQFSKRTKYSLIAAVIILGILYTLFLRAPALRAEKENFIISQSSSPSAVLDKLAVNGFLRSRDGFNFMLRLRGVGAIAPGGYVIAKSLNAWQLAGVFASSPRMKWVTIPEGLRKEEIVVILQKALGWSDEATWHWLTVDTAADADHSEGVYFPDTYLIPIDEVPADVAARLRAKFEEVFASYAKDALKQNIKWTTALKLASLVQREAAGKDDMPLIAGILWNRLEQNMNLGVDATVQYARGDTGRGWWAPITAADKKIDSPYNTYKHQGLTPHPIDNPGLYAIRAAVDPAKTSCLYYLHDSSGVIHCAKTYEEHQANINKYLR